MGLRGEGTMAKLSEVIEGLQILGKYIRGGLDSHDIGAGHDVICAGPDVDEDTPSEGDRERLEELGWHYDDEYDSWACFV
jgi:hypothetical protein